MDKRVTRFLVAVAMIVGLGLTSALVREAVAGDIVWVTERLTSTAGATAKTFAGAHDSAFYRLPEGIAHDYVVPPTANAHAWGKLTFRVTGAAVANADTIRYRIVPQVGGTRSYVNLAEQTAGSGNTAIQPAGTMTGLLFEGILLLEDNAAAANAPVFPIYGNSVLKVVGDSNGAFNSVEVWITYPKRAGARGQ